jgi:hypothetical protein
MTTSTPIRQRDILRFWMPLASTWLMMSFEGPFLAALIARLPDPRYNLAAHGVAFAMAIIIEAPVIMMMGAATALVDGRIPYLRLRRFTMVLNVREDRAVDPRSDGDPGAVAGCYRIPTLPSRSPHSPRVDAPRGVRYGSSVDLDDYNSSGAVSCC